MPPPSALPEEKALKEFLLALGLSPDQTKLYHTLSTHGALSILELARKTSLPRTRVYRLIEMLKHQKLVEHIVDENRTLIQAVPPHALKPLLEVKQAQVHQLATLFPQVEAYLTHHLHRRQADTNVKFYKGKAGIQQMAANILKATNGTVGYTQTLFENCVGNKFAAWLYEEMYSAKIELRDIISDGYLESVGGLKSYLSQAPNPFHKHFSTRYLPSSTFNVIHSMDVYNNVVAIYDWQGTDKEIFGVEIYNAKVAAMQRQIFELLWQAATPDDQLKPEVSTHSESSKPGKDK